MKNSYGVHMMTADDLTRWLKAHFDGQTDSNTMGMGKHMLLMLYSPTCGHCKRLSIIWNQLAELLRDMNWDTFVDIARIDITENELFLPGIVAEWLPDVYYLGPERLAKSILDPPNQKGSNRGPGVHYNIVRYDLVDSKGEGVGRLNDPIDIIEWLLDVSKLDEQSLLSTMDNTSPIP